VLSARSVPSGSELLHAKFAEDAEDAKNINKTD